MDSAYQEAILRWRAAKEGELHGDEGWLALAGLFWLHEGDNTVGCDPASDVVLPEGAAPARAAVIQLVGDVLALRGEAGVNVTVDGASAHTAVLRPDSHKPPTVVWIGRLRFIIIERSGRLAVRLWDHRTDTRAGFAGRQWYDIQDSYRVPATLTPHPEPRVVQIQTIIGTVEDMISPGVVSFRLRDRDLSLLAVREGERLRFYIRDLTSGDTTYPACRFLIADTSPDGSLTLDFNKAYSPPCAFTPYATCPLPPRENHLPLRVEAGEMYSGDSH